MARCARSRLATRSSHAGARVACRVVRALAGADLGACGLRGARGGWCKSWRGRAGYVWLCGRGRRSTRWRRSEKWRREEKEEGRASASSRIATGATAHRPPPRAAARGIGRVGRWERATVVRRRSARVAVVKVRPPALAAAPAAAIAPTAASARSRGRVRVTAAAVRRLRRRPQSRRRRPSWCSRSTCAASEGRDSWWKV